MRGLVKNQGSVRMKNLIMIFALMLSSAVLANGSWELISEDTHEGSTEQEVINIVNMFPEILDLTVIDAKDVEFLKVVDSHYQYLGESTCAPGDTRLHHDSLFYNYCVNMLDGTTGYCTASADFMPGNQDPCL